MKARTLILLLLASALVLPATASAAAGFGQLTLPGGCITQFASQDDGTDQCATGKALDGAAAVAVSPDGHSVYVASNYTTGFGWGGIAIFSRDPASGVLKQVGCISSDTSDGSDGTEGSCTVATGLRGADAVVVSPDGAFVYVGSARAGGITSFARDPATGLLTQTGCLVEVRLVGSPCAVAHVFAQVAALAVSSPFVFAGSAQRGAISTLAPSVFGFASPANPGALLANPCIATAGADNGCANGNALKNVMGLALSPDGKTLYASAADSGAVDWFSVDPATGALTQAGCLLGNAPPGPCGSSQMVQGPTSLAVSPDGQNVYVADSSSTIIALARNTSTGALTDGSCYDSPPDTSDATRAQDQPADPCSHADALDSVTSVAVSPDGSTVYSAGDGELAVFKRDAAQAGALSETACVAAGDSTCGSLTGASGNAALAVSPDGQTVYAATSDSSSLLSFGPGSAISSSRLLAARDGTVRVALSCSHSVRRRCAGSVVVGGGSSGPHSARVGVPARFAIRRGASAVVAVRLPAAARAALALHGSVTVTVLVLPVRGGGGGARRTLVVRRG
jgi:6-phosphogluconolactonase (cycloisomerase 2 family)